MILRNAPIIKKDYYCVGVAREGAVGTTDELGVVWFKSEDIIWYDREGNETKNVVT